MRRVLNELRLDPVDLPRAKCLCGVIAEHVPWAWRIYEGCPQLQDGDLVMSERPGHGMALDEAAVRAYAAR